MKKCEIIDPVETVTTWQVDCPYCGSSNYVQIDNDVDWGTSRCDKCEKMFIVNLKEWHKRIKQEL